VPQKELLDALRSGRHLRLKQGFDPTVPVITLGWAVGLRKLRKFQNLGHTVVVIIGDWTARIGDPSGKSETRPMLTEEQVMANSEKILRQFYKVLDPEKTEIRRQTEWFDKFSLTDVVRLTARFTIAQILERDDFAQRFGGQLPIGVHELLYPLLQGYDSVAIESDVEFGGTDQKFNNLVGRELQRMMGQEAGPAGQGQAVFLVPLLVGLDGVKKMSQSFDNFVGIDDAPDDMYGKLMSIPDSLVPQYFELLTDVPDKDIEAARSATGTAARDAKMRLAREIVAQFHSGDAATHAQEDFEITFSIRADPQHAFDLIQLPPGIVDVTVPFNGISSRSESLPPLLCSSGLVATLSEGRRLIRQGAVELVGRDKGQGMYSRKHGATLGVIAVLEPGAIIRVGKHRFLRIVDADKG